MSRRTIFRPTRQPTSSRRESPQPRRNDVHISRELTAQRETPQPRPDTTKANADKMRTHQESLMAPKRWRSGRRGVSAAGASVLVDDFNDDDFDTGDFG